MTIVEAEKLYDQDKREYQIGRNKNFLYWLKESIKNGYHFYTTLDELQELIDNIVMWYEIKYPERTLTKLEGISYLAFDQIKDISNVMDIEQLLYRLTAKQLRVMKCEYRGMGGSNRLIYRDGKRFLTPQTYVQINKPQNRGDLDRPSILIGADPVSGNIYNNYKLEECLGIKDAFCLDELLHIIESDYKGKVEYSELKQCVYNHDTDLELRHRILQLVALKLLYSKNTTPERGYERARKFIKEFNDEMGLTLSTSVIDEIIGRDYTDGEKWEGVLKTYTDANGKEHSFLTTEKVTDKKVKGLVKSLFKKNSK